MTRRSAAEQAPERTSAERRNEEIVLGMWRALYAKDFEGVAAAIAHDGLYEDVPAPDSGAVGPENVVKRLRCGLEPVERFEHELHRLVVSGDTVVLEHTEVWHFATGERVRNHFVTVHALRGGKITLWRDYWDLNTLMAQAPKWWIERLAAYDGSEWAGGPPPAFAPMPR